MGVLAYNFRHMLQQYYVIAEEGKRSMEQLIKGLVKVGARVTNHARRPYVDADPAFSLARHSRDVLLRVIRTFWLTEERTVRYSQNQQEMRISQQRDDGFADDTLWGSPGDDFFGVREPSLGPLAVPRNSRWQDRRITAVDVPGTIHLVTRIAFIPLPWDGAQGQFELTPSEKAHPMAGQARWLARRTIPDDLSDYGTTNRND